MRFRVWAPTVTELSVQLEGQPTALPMCAEADGWYSLNCERAGAGTRYRFRLPGGRLVPDPASRFQPLDVHGPSEIIDPMAYHWRDQHWRGRPWHDAVIYELHVGTFTPAGTYLAAMERLEHLASLGVTAIELMPLADFPGRRNWGYDGVLPFAPDASYGRPEDLKALIDEAHAHGLMVFVDVVYNHFGPEGNYLPLYAAPFFNERHHTPWGAAINFDAPGSRTVREFFIHNALYWLEEFHCDGLRLDAVHAIRDDSDSPFLEQLARRVRAAVPQRRVHLILENEHNEPSWLERNAQAAPRLYDAQWNDDVHHVLHVAASQEHEGYYADFHQDDGSQLGRALAQGFAFQGEAMRYRGSARGAPSTHLPPSAFVAFLQNHDQIGNRAFGERLTRLAPPEAVRVITAAYLLLPQIPMLFMGEEWHSERPFLFFCDFGADLADAVRRGRRQEFARFAAFQDPQVRERIPDPQAEATFLASKLDWEQLDDPTHAAVLRWYRALLAVRRRHIAPLLPELRHAGEFRVISAAAVSVLWRSSRGSELTLTVNLQAHATSGFAAPSGRLLWQEGRASPAGTLGPWSLRCVLRD